MCILLTLESKIESAMGICVNSKAHLVIGFIIQLHNISFPNELKIVIQINEKRCVKSFDYFSPPTDATIKK